MSRFQGPRGLTIGAIVLTFLWGVGCSRPLALESGEDAASADQRQVPFKDSEGRSTTPGDSSATQSSGLKSETELPFQEPQNLPAGTLLSVRLKSPIIAGNPSANGSFEAVIDQPITIAGDKLVPLGAVVSGHVESARTSNFKRNRGYVRLTLESIRLAGSNVPIETSSLFVSANAGQAEAPPSELLSGPASTTAIRLEKGRQLIFRLTEPVFVATSQPTARND